MMRSITRHMDAHDIAAEIRLERQNHKGSFLLLEGETDIKRLDAFLSSRFCSVVNCFGRKRAYGAMCLLNQTGFTGAIALLDADFDRVSGQLLSRPGVIYSDTHDLDLDWCEYDEVCRYLDMMGDEQKVGAAHAVGNIRDRILQSLKPLSLVRLGNESLRLCVSLSRVRIGDHYQGYRFDVDTYLDEVFALSPHKVQHKPNLLAFVARELTKSYDLEQLTNGHDMHAALGILLRNELGGRTNSQTWSSEVGKHFYLMCNTVALLGKSVIKQLRAWESDEGYTVFEG